MGHLIGLLTSSTGGPLMEKERLGHQITDRSLTLFLYETQE